MYPIPKNYTDIITYTLLSKHLSLIWLSKKYIFNLLLTFLPQYENYMHVWQSQHAVACQLYTIYLHQRGHL